MVAQVMPLRSRARDGEATRDAILAAAAALLASGGEEGLSIRELCARAGVTAPTVYHHFGDKASLVARVIDSCFEEFERGAACPRGGPGRGAARGVRPLRGVRACAPVALPGAFRPPPGPSVRRRGVV